MPRTTPGDGCDLIPRQIQEFYEQGFLRIDQLYTPTEMDQIDAAFDRLHDHAMALRPTLHGASSVKSQEARFTFTADGNAVRHIAMCGNAEPVLKQYGEDARLRAIAAAFLDSRQMDQLINQAHYKRPGGNVKFDWHQDATHRGMANGGFVDLNGHGSYVQIALAVDDETPDNGPLQFIPCTPRLGFIAEELAGRIDPAEAVSPLLRRGDVVAFGPYTVHGSQANTSQRSRRTFINGFAYPGANRRDYGLTGAGRRLTL